MIEENHPVSVLVDREILPGKKDEFEFCLKGIIEAGTHFPGYLGTDVTLPDTHNEHHYRVVFRYSTLKEMKAWESSKERHHWLEKIDKLTKEPTQLQVITGLETWFALPRAKTMVPPKRYKMAIVTWLALTPLLIGFNLAFAPWLQHLGMVQRILVSTPILVLIMTYALMPFMVNILGRWLFPNQGK